MSKDTIKAVIDEYLTLEQSEKNQQRKKKWSHLVPIGRDQIRITPKVDGSWRTEGPPFAADMQNQYWAKVLHFDLDRYYYDPEYYLEYYLRAKMKHFEMFDDDVFLSKDILMCGGAIYEGSMYGMGYQYWKDSDPQLEYTKKLIETPEDLERMPKMDFYRSGIMDQTIRWYEGVRDLTEGLLHPCFPEYVRGVFGVATYLCGMENLLMNMMEEPEFVHDIFRYIDDCRTAWYTEYYRYLGIPWREVCIFNDEISTPMVSPDIYREFIYPIEKGACDAHGRLAYWHSCGNTTILGPEIAKIGDIEMFNLSAWSEVKPHCEVFGKKSALEICINHLPDIFRVKNTQQIEDKITGILRICDETDVNGFTIRAAGIAASEEVGWVTDRVHDWCYHTRKAIEEMKY